MEGVGVAAQAVSASCHPRGPGGQTGRGAQPAPARRRAAPSFPHPRPHVPSPGWRCWWQGWGDAARTTGQHTAVSRAPPPGRADGGASRPRTRGCGGAQGLGCLPPGGDSPREDQTQQRAEEDEHLVEHGRLRAQDGTVEVVLRAGAPLAAAPGPGWSPEPEPPACPRLVCVSEGGRARPGVPCAACAGCGELGTGPGP